ncbi:hypothetical protein GCM10009007_03230 [Formosimonas limnophila]|uniref:Uncharacterized protein n=2 Tax=Formosimonas limnophila TaxID=1384487 RepID=A0A8J3CLJ4_9BURK|nr:hypothetical protein GCM10009007_03230 [Formosimonas limnophila]
MWFKGFNMARPTFAPTDAQREQVKILSACGVPQKNICQILAGKNPPMDEKTLRKHFAVELDNGSALANAKVAQSLFKKATGGNVTAQIFWLKTRAGWKETQHVEHAGTIETKQSPANLSDEQLTAMLKERGISMSLLKK